jgi:hypothetical protein
VIRGLFAAFLLTAPAWAGICTADSSEPRHDFQFFAGYSPVPATLIGTTTDREFLVAGFGYSYRCWFGIAYLSLIRAS